MRSPSRLYLALVVLSACGGSQPKKDGGGATTPDGGEGAGGASGKSDASGADKRDTGVSGPMQVDDVITLAGDRSSSSQDSYDGPGLPGLLEGPVDLASDDGHLYVLEGHAASRVRVLDRVTGVVTTLAGAGTEGYADGQGVTAQFDNPYGLTIDPSHQNLYVADTGNAVVRRIAIATGQVTTIAGVPDGFGSTDGIGGNARFSAPWGIAIDSRGEQLYVTDVSKIRVVNLANNEVTTLAGSATGDSDGVGAAASFNAPKGLAIDAADAKLYAVDGATQKIRVVDIATRQVTTLATRIYAGDGFESTAGFTKLWSVTVDPTSTFLYVTEGAGLVHVVRQVELATGTVRIIAGSRTSDGYVDAAVGTQARLSTPRGLRVIDQAVYVADDGNKAIRTIAVADHSVTTYAGGPHPAYFLQPFGVVNDGKYLYVTDSGSNSMLRKVSMTSGYTRTIAGVPSMAHDDGIGTEARFNVPMGVALGGSHLYIADSENHEIRVVDLSSSQVTTLAGSYSQTGAADGVGSAATFDTPAGAAVDRAGRTLYVSDRGNHEIRKLDIASGQVSTLAGSPTSGFVDGIGSAASFETPADIVLDPTEASLYVADSGNHAIRKVDVMTGAVSTVAGSGTAGSADGVGTAATFNMPLGLTTDGTWLYVADSKNSEIRKIELSSARVTTVYGRPRAGSNDGTGTHASFNMPIGLSLDAAAGSIIALCLRFG